MISTRKTANMALLILFMFAIITPVYSETETFAVEAPQAEEPAIIEEETQIAELPTLEDELAFSEEALSEEELLALIEELFTEDLNLDNDSIFFEGAPIIVEATPFLGNRSFNDIFPNLTRSQMTRVRSETGLRYSFEKNGSPTLIPDTSSGVDLLGKVMAKKPSHVVEALVLVPYQKRELDMLDVYNALGSIKSIKEQTVTMNGRNVNIFVESTRLESARNRRAIADPSPVDMLPYSETMFLRFTDQFFGDLFIRGDITMSLYGLTYSMTNFTDVRYAFIPLIRAERVSVIIYLEPIQEGILVYSMSGFYLPSLIANSANLTPNINRRVTIFQNWITDGLRKQEIIDRPIDIF